MPAALQKPGMVDMLRLPEGCGKFARYASRKVTLADPGELRSCPKAPDKLSNSCCGSLDSAPIRPNMAEFGQYLPDLGQVSRTFGQVRPKMVGLGQC